MERNDIDVALIPVDLSDELREMLDRFPLPTGVADADMNQEELASALSQSVNTIAKWIREDMPVARPGRNGQPYILRLSHCYAWMRWRDALRDERTAHNKAQAAAMQAELLGLKLDDPNAQMSPKQRREMAEADLVWNKAQRERRQLAPIDDVRELMEGMLSIIRDGIEAMPDRLERELQLRPEQVTAAIRVGRDVLDALAVRIAAEHLPDLDAGEVLGAEVATS
ncbi:DUF1441 family protein [Pseudomonas sp. GX19020]|uniref:DUF1441 family protein n=1 Tax=Pseudomonas sp. GX19020 TaxID=2942277 RepID=UPI0020187472|nr:DUF1441 family protein [Pseudomonas sp. GX19020]MCL4069011.1 DUF1441 family protein [Pseudomonas sp. GX19020]